MNNEQRNTYVRAQITKALIELLKEQRLEDISIKQLTEKAQVGRVSFYRNFSSKEDVLYQESHRLFRQWGDPFAAKPQQEYESFFLGLFDFLRENRSFYMTLYQAGLSSVIQEMIVQTAALSPGTPNLEAYLKSFWAYGIYGWVLEWIKRGMAESGKDLLVSFLRLQNLSALQQGEERRISTSD